MPTLKSISTSYEKRPPTGCLNWSVNLKDYYQGSMAQLPFRASQSAGCRLARTAERDEL
jgi:hypothetical protein